VHLTSLAKRLFAIGKPLQSESPSGKCAKLHIVAASNNRDHSIIACSHHMYMGAILSTHLVCGKWHVHHHAERLQQP